MVVALVSALTAVLFGQLDALSFHAIDGPHVDPVRPDDFHVLFDAHDVPPTAMRLGRMPRPVCALLIARATPTCSGTTQGRDCCRGAAPWTRLGQICRLR